MKKQKGFTLVELAVGITVAGIAATVFLNSFREWDGKQAAENLGSTLSPVAQAAQVYINTNSSALQATTPVVAGFANPLKPTVAELKVAGLLSNNYVANGNILGANTLIQIGKTPVGCVAPNCNVNYTVYLDKPWLDDKGLANVRRVAQAAAKVSGGGFSSYTAPNILSAPDGSWSVTNPLAQSGVLAAFGSTGATGNIGCASFTATAATIGTTASLCNTTINGTLTTTGSGTFNNGLTVSNANGAYTYITLKDDESPNGVKYIHANSNNIGFLNGNGGWASRWDNNGNQVNSGNISAGNNGVAWDNGGEVNADHLHAIRGDSWFPYPGNGYNYIRGGIIMDGGGASGNNGLYIYGNGQIHLDPSDGWGINNNARAGWAMVTHNADNANPRDAQGSLHVNDIYLRSVGKWGSQISTPQTTIAYGEGWGSASVCCPAGYVVSGLAANSEECTATGTWPIGNNCAGAQILMGCRTHTTHLWAYCLKTM